MKKLLLAIALLILSPNLFAQSEGQQVEVRLYNGSIIKGTITDEDENGNIIIEDADGNVYEYQAKEIKSIKNINARRPKYRRGYIGLSAGPSIPLGDFADEFNGGAKVGVNLSLANFGYLFNDHIGITGSWFGGANPIEDLGYDDYDLWSYGGVTVGPLFSFQLSPYVDLDLRPMIGYSITTAPDFGYDTESAAAVAYNGSVMFRFHCSNRISILLNTDVLYTKPTFDYYNFSQNITTISINGGIAYRFN